jgi:hypothetical protein
MDAETGVPLYIAALIILSLFLLVAYLKRRLDAQDVAIKSVLESASREAVNGLPDGSSQAAISEGAHAVENVIGPPPSLNDIPAAEGYLSERVLHALDAQAAQRLIVIDSLKGKFAEINDKLDLLSGAATPLLPTPLSKWTFTEYRLEYDKWKKQVVAMSNDAGGHSTPEPKIYTISEIAGEIRLVAELAKTSVESGALRWIANHGPHVILHISAIATVHAAVGLYLPVIIALMHYIEAQHVRAQQHALAQDTGYLIGIHEDANEATLRERWRSAQDLLGTPNMADARMQLRAICSDLAQFRYREIRSSVREFAIAAKKTARDLRSRQWMHSCLKTIDRLKDAIVLECLIRISLDEMEQMTVEVIRAEKEELRVAVAECRSIRKERLARTIMPSKRQEIRLYLKTTPMRLRAYSRLLEYINLCVERESSQG